MCFPVRAVGAETVLAMMVSLAVEAQAAVLALFVLRALSAPRTEMVFEVIGCDAVAVVAAARLAEIVAAVLA